MGPKELILRASASHQSYPYRGVVQSLDQPYLVRIVRSEHLLRPRLTPTRSDGNAQLYSAERREHMAIVSASLSTDRTLTARLIEESTLGTLCLQKAMVEG